MNTILTKNSGFSLIEILISLVIMSVGMMGLAGLKMVSIKGTNSAHFRHESSLLMADLADRMRSNIDAVNNGTYEAETAVNISAAPSPDCSETICSADELSEYDKYQIALKMSLAIPNSSLFITCPDSDCSTTVNDVKKNHTIIINWKEKKDKSEDMGEVDEEGTAANEFNDQSITLEITP